MPARVRLTPVAFGRSRAAAGIDDMAVSFCAVPEVGLAIGAKDNVPVAG